MALWECKIDKAVFDTKADALYHVTHRPIDHEIERGRTPSGKLRAEQYIRRLSKKEAREYEESRQAVLWRE